MNRSRSLASNGSSQQTKRANSVISAQARIHFVELRDAWTLAFAGVTHTSPKYTNSVLSLSAICLVGMLALPVIALAAVIGTNVPAQALTQERIAELPATQRAAWSEYLKRSIEQMRIDRETLTAELKPGQTAPPPPVAGRNGDHQMPFDREPAWYASPEARKIADTVVSFQTPTGGWSKNQGRAGPPRLRGQRYNNNAETMEPNPSNFDAPRDRYWTYVGTLDNGATTTELRYLARVAAQVTRSDGDVYRESFLKGVRYLLAAQYPNGGWPQVYPLQGGYHDAVTFNDNAVAEAAMLLADVALGTSEFAFVPAELRAQASASSRRAVEVILASQVIVDGKRTIWPQQADPLTLQPSSARNYEPQSLATAESTDILLFLMRQPKPSSAIKAAVSDAVSWLKAHEIYDIAWTMTPDGRQRVAKPGAGPLWSRNYDIVTGKPIFGDRDKSIHDDVNEISLERRNNYAWYSDAPRKAIKAFEKWSRDNSGSP